MWRSWSQLYSKQRTVLSLPALLIEDAGGERCRTRDRVHFDEPEEARVAGGEAHIRIGVHAIGQIAQKYARRRW
ncbi:MAG: hypothetical protein ACI9MR_003133 [Myxococcota bacterium]|jgi:hypothetical protein